MQKMKNKSSVSKKCNVTDVVEKVHAFLFAYIYSKSSQQKFLAENDKLIVKISRISRIKIPSIVKQLTDLLIVNLIFIHQICLGFKSRANLKSFISELYIYGY